MLGHDYFYLILLMLGLYVIFQLYSVAVTSGDIEDMLTDIRSKNTATETGNR